MLNAGWRYVDRPVIALNCASFVTLFLPRFSRAAAIKSHEKIIVGMMARRSLWHCVCGEIDGRFDKGRLRPNEDVITIVSTRFGEHASIITRNVSARSL